MGVLAGLSIMALTDHNTSGNCPAFFEACRRYGIIPVAGMELTTAEDIHLVCLFERLDDAMRFDRHVAGHILPVDNNPGIFGRQLLMDSEDKVLGQRERLLISATDIGIEAAPALVRDFGGVCYPAHVDRISNGIVSVLGDFPDYLGFSVCEFHDSENYEEYAARYPAIAQCMTVCSSDAHRLADIRDAVAYFDLDDDPYSSALVRKNLFRKLLFQ